MKNNAVLKVAAIFEPLSTKLMERAKEQSHTSNEVNSEMPELSLLSPQLEHLFDLPPPAGNNHIRV